MVDCACPQDGYARFLSSSRGNPFHRLFGSCGAIILTFALCGTFRVMELKKPV
jgi:hypothetical protein